MLLFKNEVLVYDKIIVLRYLFLIFNMPVL
jgi:hypothetical protein